MATRTRRVAIVAYDGAQTLDIAGPLEVFAGAARYAHRGAAPPYAVAVVAARAGRVRMQSGLTLIADQSYREVRAGIDTLIVAGGNARAATADAALLRWLCRMLGRVRRLASVCTGAFVLAEAGILAGRRATTHWASAGALARQYPRVRVEPDALYVQDGHVYTSAGVTAGMDLALALVEEDLGHATALTVARHLVLFLKRPGGQSQFSTYLAAQTSAPGPLGDLLQWIVEHPDGNLGVGHLAARAGMSPRHFARVFVAATGTTPAKFVANARIEHARRRLEESRGSLKVVANDCGFGSAERMRRTFQRHLHVVPNDYRQRFIVR
jgi:transcriptional regulator GlxA family with amidase domain